MVTRSAQRLGEHAVTERRRVDAVMGDGVRGTRRARGLVHQPIGRQRRVELLGQGPYRLDPRVRILPPGPLLGRDRHQKRPDEYEPRAEFVADPGQDMAEILFIRLHGRLPQRSAGKHGWGARTGSETPGVCVRITFH
jgi:hypothetical protein